MSVFFRNTPTSECVLLLKTTHSETPENPAIKAVQEKVKKWLAFNL